MDKQQTIEQLGLAWTAIDSIDLRGRKRDSVIHSVVTTAKESVAAAYDALVEDEGE